MDTPYAGLQPLSDEHAKQVNDIPINAGNLGLASILKSWNPLSHVMYWTDKAVITHLAATVKSLM